MNLKDKKIILGVSGGIAAYKIVQVARDLTKEGAEVHVLLSEAAARFVTPLTFQTLTRQKVYTGLWEGWTDEEMGHISLSSQADLVILAPATADIMAKLANGLANDIITTTYLATPPQTPFLVVPAMEQHMYLHPATQQNMETLRSRGATIMKAITGLHASGASGPGRLPEPAEIVAAARQLLGKHRGDLRDKRFLITAGGTQEPLDPVRFIANGSSGQMGYALAREALERGAEVILISGPVKLEPPYGVRFINVRTTREMEKAVQAVLKEPGAIDVLIMAAAVADFRPKNQSVHKIKKGASGTAPYIELELNPDILQGLNSLPGLEKLFRVGFAAETDDLLKNASKKLQTKNLDLIVANEAVSSIGSPDNQVILVERSGQTTSLERLPKAEVARFILDKVLQLITVSDT